MKTFDLFDTIEDASLMLQPQGVVNMKRIEEMTMQKINANRKQAEMTAWRNVRDWVLAQMALVESCDVPVDQVFLPYLRNYDGATLYDVYANGQLRLEAGK